MSNYYEYFTRTIPAWSVVCLVSLLITSLVVAPSQRIERGQQHGEATVSQLILTVYTVFLHILAILFPSRVCWAIGDVTKVMKQRANIRDVPKRHKTRGMKSAPSTVASPVPLFVIIIPAYKEEMETLEETLRVLAIHPQARSSYHIYLAMEEKEKNSADKASTLISLFQKSFYKMNYSVHPSGVPGEAQGKSSNESWAAKQAFKDYRDGVMKDVILTVMDADTHLSPRYFAQVTRHHIDEPVKSAERIYVPPLVFDRNLQQVPLIVRLADLVWAGAGISNLYTGSTICIPTAVYSLSMKLAERVGGWDTGPGAIGEDMHMYLKCFFALSGNLDVKVVYAAASQCDVSSDVEGFSGYIDGINARYKQALRHMWGAMDSGYAVRQCVEMVERRFAINKDVLADSSSLAELAFYVRNLILDGLSMVCFPTWNALESNSKPPKILVSKPSTAGTAPAQPIHILNVATLFHRLFEAHFLPVHLGFILTATTVCDIVAGSSIPRELALALRFCGFARFIAFSLIFLYLYRYATYHKLCVQLRRQDMQEAGLEQEPMKKADYQVFGTLGVLEPIFFPIGGLIFGSIPACQAVISHVFTDKLVYHVSLKPQFLQKWPTPASPQKSDPHKSIQQNPTRVQCPPRETWRQQTFSSISHATSWLAFGRPVKRED